MSLHLIGDIVILVLALGSAALWFFNRGIQAVYVLCAAIFFFMVFGGIR